MVQPRKKKQQNELPRIAVQVKNWRISLAMRQSDLASRAGVSHNAVSRIETGQHEPKLETIEKLADAMKISVEQLQFGKPFVDGEKGTRSSTRELQKLVDRLEGLNASQRKKLIKSIMNLIDLMED